MRTFIRHPSDIPLEIQAEDCAGRQEETLNNVGIGGVCLKSQCAISEGAVVRIRITLVRPPFEARGKVVWCKPEETHFDVGVEFTDAKDVFRARMVEQVVRIERYKKQVQEQEGRNLSGREAALEWIRKFADAFTAELVEK